MQQDILHIVGVIQLPNGTQLTGYQPVDGVNDIEAIYELNTYRLSVTDHGELTHQASDIATLSSEAPIHAQIVTNMFTGNLVLSDVNATLSFENNQLVLIS